MKKIIKLMVDKQYSSKRLDTFISSKITDVSRTRVKNLILEGMVKITASLKKEPNLRQSDQP